MKSIKFLRLTDSEKCGQCSPIFQVFNRRGKENMADLCNFHYDVWVKQRKALLLIS